ncbi:hypothetical protein ACU8KH_05751 [Lachancea thermotolerans]
MSLVTREHDSRADVNFSQLDADISRVQKLLIRNKDQDFIGLLINQLHDGIFQSSYIEFELLQKASFGGHSLRKLRRISG